MNAVTLIMPTKKTRNGRISNHLLSGFVLTPSDVVVAFSSTNFSLSSVETSSE